MLNPEFHWPCQIATILSKFHWQFWIFWDAIAKAKKLICESKAQNLKQVSLTKSFLALAIAFSLLLSNLTYPPLPKLKHLFVSELEPRPKVAKLFLSVARGWHIYIWVTLLGCTSGLNLAADLGPFLPLLLIKFLFLHHRSTSTASTCSSTCSFRL